MTDHDRHLLDPTAVAPKPAVMILDPKPAVMISAVMR